MTLKLLKHVNRTFGFTYIGLSVVRNLKFIIVSVENHLHIFLRIFAGKKIVFPVQRGVNDLLQEVYVLLLQPTLCGTQLFRRRDLKFFSLKYILEF